ncbi:MAG: hypothetical protein HQ446_01310 [Polaromonas sp.]|nr:hypothetical protein [Polaromonas sp.]
MHHPHIIGLSGPAGSGKDTVADLLVKHAGFTKMAFADPLRLEVVQAFAIDLSFLTQRETKETPMRCLAINRCLDEGFVARMIVMHTLRGDRLDLDAPRSPRQIMQWWGTDYRRHQFAGYWIGQTEALVKHLWSERTARDIVITDVRFADEAQLVRHTFGGHLWQIERDGVGIAPGSHISETTGSAFKPDVVINNSYTVKHLAARTLESYWASVGLAPGGSSVGISV